VAGSAKPFCGKKQPRCFVIPFYDGGGKTEGNKPNKNCQRRCSAMLNPSNFSYGNGFDIADSNAGLTTQAFVWINRFRFAVNQVQHTCRAATNAFLAAGAFIFVYLYFPHAFFSCLSSFL
jgi:hypothetical protein